MKLNSKAAIFFLLFNLGFISPSHADAICKDGSRSNSSGSGTCSWHGGVSEWLPKIGSVFNYKQDSHYDSSDNGVHPCKYRRLGESKKECEARARYNQEVAYEMIRNMIDKQTLETNYNPFSQ